MPLYDNQRFCAVPDHVGADRICKWEKRAITWCWYRGNLPASVPLGDQEIHACFQRAVQSWCAPRTSLTATYTTNNKTANVLISFDRKNPLGSRLGVLAWCELPCSPGHKQCRMMIDTVEDWIISLTPPPDKVDLERVFKHEFGHGIGIDHIGNGNLMAPTYSASIPDLMQGDMVAALARYPVTPPQTPPTPPPQPPETVWRELAAIGMRGDKLALRALGKEITLDSLQQMGISVTDEVLAIIHEAQQGGE